MKNKRVTKSQQYVWDALRNPVLLHPITNDTDLLNAISFAKQTGQQVKPLEKYIITLAAKVASDPNFQHYMFIDDMQQAALLQMLVSINTFDTSQGYNPSAYLKQVCIGTFHRHLQQEIRIAGIKDNVAERIKVGQGY